VTVELHMDCHVHTCFSGDCRTALKRLIGACRNQGINCLAVTDHNTIDGALVLQKIAPFKIIAGEEIKTSQGEIIGYFLKRTIRPGMSPLDTVRAIKEQGGLVCIPHPFDRWRGSALNQSALYKIFEYIDIIEVFNARNIFAADNAKALQFAQQNGKAMTVGSDSHFADEIGRCYVVMPDFKTPADFLYRLSQAEYVCNPGRFEWTVGTSIVKMLKSVKARLMFNRR